MANESYENGKENKFLLDVELSTWKSKIKSATKAMSKSDHKSRQSSKTGRSSITSSVREKCKILEEARLRVEALEQKQSMERLLKEEEEEEEAEFRKRELEIAEEREQSKAELARKIEKMQVEMEVKNRRASSLDPYGSDRPDILITIQRSGEKSQLYAVNTPLGWTVYGPVG